MTSKTKGQFGRECRVELQRNQSAAAPREYLSNCAMARPNLNHRPLAKIAESVDDGMAGSIIHKKVLAEFWLTFHLHPMLYYLPRALID